MIALKIELIKLFRRKSTKVLMIIYGSILLLFSALYWFGERSLGLSIFTEGQFIRASLSVMMGMMLPFICLYISSTSFALDFSKGTIKNMFLLPMEKGSIFLGKLLAIQSLIGILLGIQIVFSLIFGLVLDGGFGLGVLGIYLLEYIGAFLILGLVNLAGATFSLLVSSTGLAVLLSYLTYIGMGVVSIYFPKFRAISVSNIMGSYSELITHFNPSVLLSVIAYYIILFIVGSLIFEKKEESICQYE